METTKQKIGGTTVTKVRREEVMHSGMPRLTPYQEQERIGGGGGGLSPVGSGKPLFQVSSNTGGGNKPKPGVWAPGGQAHKPVSAPGRVITAPPGVKVTENKDHSITMSIAADDTAGSGGKENVAPVNFAPPKNPVPQFNVKRVQTNQAPSGSWQPSYMPSKPAAPTQNIQPLSINTSTEDTNVGQGSVRPDTHFPFEAPSWHLQDNPDGEKMDTDERMDSHAINIHLAKILHEGPGSDMDSGNESPGYWARKSKDFSL